MQQNTNQNVLEDLSRLESILVNGYAEDSDDKAMLPKLCNKYPFQLVQLFDQHQLMYKPDTQALILISYKVASCILQQSLSDLQRFMVCPPGTEAEQKAFEQAQCFLAPMLEQQSKNN